MHVLTNHPRTSTSTATLAAVVSAVAVCTACSGVTLLVPAVLAPAAAAAVLDVLAGRIPDRLVGLAAAPSLIAVLVDVAVGRTAAVFAAVLVGSVLFATPLLVVHLLAPGAMGFGDVKLGAALGAGLGLVDPRAAVLALCLATVVTVAAGLARRRASMPFAPGLVVGAAMCVGMAAVLEERAWAWR